jgi:hypothetical protein
MTPALFSLGIISTGELSLYLAPLWRYHKTAAWLLAVALVLTSGWLISEELTVWTVLVLIMTVYRVLNLGRMIKDRLQADYLLHASRRTTYWLIGVQLSILLAAALDNRYHMSATTWWYLLAAGQLLLALTLLASTIRHLRTTLPLPITKAYTDGDLPTLTVAIPARNETTDLETCLQSLISSTYPKLEILVLDDCSQNKRTPEIIRGFAHDGVRFVAGTVAPGQWLAKNHAYAQLADEANGELLLFCGVDARFQPDSLSLLVKTLLQKEKAMLSIIPRNTLVSHFQTASLVVQPNRYVWELALPRRLLQRPPVLSTCWLISHQALKAAGSFQAVSSKSLPESYLARATAAYDGYSFLQATQTMGVSTHKALDEQRDTAIRTRYPQLHQRSELVALVGLVELSVSIWPLILLIAALASKTWLLAGLSAASYLMVTSMYSKIVNLTYRQFVLRGMWLLPLAAIYDIGLLNYSMWKYEFREVIWKGRNVCIPLIQVVPSLPKLH